MRLCARASGGERGFSADDIGDRLLAELLIRNKNWIVSYHEHDSLLQNITSEELTEEERMLAWEEYRNEREGRINSNIADLRTTAL
ncbi:hypothetical protein HPB51_007052 [Rhipicephalus microplus]|uniref:Uncharacterized protein n=1 Tax=Rhipicephalus microplus TaxID=6941 RepID=A0A9J6DT84_RHIMP|nr:hypothetical protein HPB51_007052 [Rhipicephalus microplus]